MHALDAPLSRISRARSTICAVTTKRSAASWMQSKCQTGLLKTW